MARKQTRVAHALNFAATPRWRTTVFWAALAFAVCHLLAISTDRQAVSPNSNLPLELVHFGAVLCRFLLPFGIMLAGCTVMAGKWRRSASDIGLRSL